MKVDNTTDLAFNQKCNTVRITTRDRFTDDSVWIADMLRVPFGVRLLLCGGGWFLSHIRRRQHVAQLAELSTHRARLHSR